ncbi:DUF1648 domain-containing protein [Phytoactinopolyspora endophytica]|uniref:DUF1648 domain-containing protein n=1 Tax=Phytoactinopolyspora endophytica TaxID=1642495 RepID=UPI00101CAA36|nr:DUF1648 domain-containing protein [Phytoactinopolyspora endophytica]
MTHATPQTPRTRPSGRTLLASAGIPFLVAFIGALLVWSWRDDLPSRVAIHWGTSGANGFASVEAVAGMIAAFGVAFPAIALILSFAGRHDPTVARVVTGMTSGTTTLVTALVAGLVADQRGISDARDADLSAAAFLGAVGLAVAVTVIAISLVPRRTGSGALVPEDAPRVPLSENELVVWTRSVAAGSLMVILLAAVVGVTAITALLTGQWAVLIVTTILVGLIALMCSIRVTVDHRGMTVKSFLGWPKFQTPIDEIAHAEMARVRPIPHFGGYGYRIALFGPYRGASGFIMRGGNGVLVERTDGKRTIVVVDDAETAAGLLNAMVERARAQ